MSVNTKLDGPPDANHTALPAGPRAEERAHLSAQDQLGHLALRHSDNVMAATLAYSILLARPASANLFASISLRSLPALAFTLKPSARVRRLNLQD